jgi:hypothetical protein
MGNRRGQIVGRPTVHIRTRWRCIPSGAHHPLPTTVRQRGTGQPVLTMAETLGSMQLYAKEVAPRLKELVARHDHDRMQELRAATPDRQLTELGSFGIEFTR